jgi:hypothetical protein
MTLVVPRGLLEKLEVTIFVVHSPMPVAMWLGSSFALWPRFPTGLFRFGWTSRRLVPILQTKGLGS